MGFTEWLETFLEEKNLPYEMWEIEVDGCLHYIDSDVVIEAIKNAPKNEQEQIKKTIIQIDFNNGNVNHFFKYLAKALIIIDGKEK